MAPLRLAGGAMRFELRRWSMRSSLLALCLALVVLIVGWFSGVDLIVRLHAEFAAMVPATAISVALLAFAQLMLHVPWRHRRKVTALISVLVGMFALYHLVELGIAPPLDPKVDRMSIATSIGVLMTALANTAATRTSKLAERAQTMIATTGGILALICINGYIFDAPALYQFFILSATSLPTAFSLLFLFTALLLERPERVWVGVLCAENAGSRRALRLLPVSILGPVLLSYGALWTTQIGVITPNLRLGMIAIVLAGLTTYTVAHRARTELEENARKEADHLRAILERLDAAVFVFDAAGVLRLTNRKADTMSAYAETPDIWLHETAFHALADRRRLSGDAHPVRRLFKTMEPHAVYAGWLDTFGHEHALKFAITRAVVHRPERALTVLTVTDETEVWRLREHLARAERLEAADQLAGGIAHEMANILGVIQLTVDAALLKEQEAAQRATFETLATACHRGADLTSRLLNLTRDKASDDRPVDVVQVLARVATLAAPSLPATIELVLETPDGPAVAFCDETELERALLNLVLNARNAITEAEHRSGRITLQVHRQAEALSLAVLDDGPGMAVAMRARAVEPYFTTRAESGGTGLGLAMVDSFARRSGGALSLETTAQGGLCAVLHLPLAHEEATTDPIEEGAMDLSGFSILVVEDDSQFQDILPEALAMLGAHVQRAVEAEQALAILADDPNISLLVTDIRLGGAIDGYALAGRARQIHPGLKVIFLSGYTDPSGQLEKETPGFFLRKPVRLSTLCNAIELLMTQKSG